MKHLGQAVLEIDGLRLPGDWKKILREPGVAKLAASQKYIGPIHPPVVRASTKEILAGRRRVAAYYARGEEKILCDLVECEDDELEVIALTENAVREHDLERQKRETTVIVERLAKLELKALPEAEHATKAVRGATKRAMDAFAKVEGVKTDAIIKRIQREKWRQEEKEAAKLPKPDPIESPWVELDEDFKKAVIRVQEQTENITRLVEQALSATTKLRSCNNLNGCPIVQEDRLQRLAEDLSQVGAAARGLKPTSICPDCKGQTDAQKLCVLCRGCGYITKNQMAGIPAEMLDVATPKIRWRGVVMLLTDYLLERYPAVQAPPKEEELEAVMEAELAADASTFAFGLEE